MNGKGLVLALFSAGVGVGSLTLNGQRTLSREIAEIRDDICDLTGRLARLEGCIDTLIE